MKHALITKIPQRADTDIYVDGFGVWGALMFLVDFIPTLFGWIWDLVTLIRCGNCH